MIGRLLFANGTDIAAWAERHTSISDFPVLVRKLIRCSDRSANIDDFRDDKGTAIKGWDGIVLSEVGGAQLPAGKSLWELSTAQNPLDAANDNYDKRTNEPLGEDKVNSVFIFATARRWAGKRKWQAEKKARGEWRDVLALDADDIAQWLESFIAVHLEFSRQIGTAPASATALSAFWYDWSNATKWPVTNALLLAGRKEQAEKIAGWLNGEPAICALQADTADEAIAVLAATIETMEPADSEMFFARAIVVNDEADWVQLSVRQEPLVLIARQAQRGNVATALEHGHHVLIPIGPSEKNKNAITLPRVSVQGARGELERAGLKGRVDELAQTARHSMGAFRRKIAKNKAVLLPEWLTQADPVTLVPAVLLLQWDDRNENDQAALARLSGKSYADTIAIFQTWSQRSDPPIRKTGPVWRIVAPQDSWELLAQYIDRGMLDKFKQLALEVLGEIDGKWDMKDEERMMARVNGVGPIYSEHLRYGISRALALMGAFDVYDSAAQEDIASWARVIVWELLATANSWQFWASHYETLSLLAEAAPDEFLAAVDQDLRTKDPVLRGLFHDDTNALFSGSPHPGLLWALETLAWSRDYLAPAALALARLSQVDPGGKVSNRPSASLKTIFCSWHPYTSASVDERLGVLGLLRKETPDTGWEIMICLLPNHFNSVHDTSKPHYRDWVPDEYGKVTYSEIWQTHSQIVDWLIQDVGVDVSRWCELIERAPLLAESEFLKVGSQLVAISAQIKAEKDRLLIWDAIRRKLALHYRNEDKSVKVSQAGLDLFGQALKSFTPSNPALTSKWLFCHHALSDIWTRESDTRADQARLSKMQGEAAQDVWKAGGLDAILELAEGVDRPDMIGWQLGKALPIAKDDTEFIARLLTSEDRTDLSIGGGFVSGKAAQHGEPWVLGLLADPATQCWPPAARVVLYGLLPFAAKTWDRLDAEKTEVITEYWMSAWPWRAEALGQEEFDRALACFVTYGRLGAAVVFIRTQDRNEAVKLPIDMTFDLLARLMKYDFSNEKSVDAQSVAFGIYEILTMLEESGEVERSALAQLQYAWLPLYKNYGRENPRVLFEVLGEEPKLFIQLLSSIYKSRNKAEADEAESTERDKRWASHNYHVLSEWSLPPGCDRNGSVDADKLNGWVKEARRLAAECGRSEVCDSTIGDVLANYPAEADGIWPHTVLRNLIEEVASQELEDGIACGLYNSRDVFSRSMTEGGEQERALVEKYTGFAEACRNWPRTSRLLRRIADSYKHDARREDDERELREDGVF